MSGDWRAALTLGREDSRVELRILLFQLPKRWSCSQTPLHLALFTLPLFCRDTLSLCRPGGLKFATRCLGHPWAGIWLACIIIFLNNLPKAGCVPHLVLRVSQLLFSKCVGVCVCKCVYTCVCTRVQARS